MKNTNITEAIVSAIVAFATNGDNSFADLTADEMAVVSGLTGEDLAEIRNADPRTGKYCEIRLKALRIKARNEKAAELLGMSRGPMFTEFIQNPAYTFPVLAVDKDTGKWVSRDSSRTLSFLELDKAFQLRESKETDSNGNPLPNKTVTLGSDSKWELFLGMFLDNLQLNNAQNNTLQALKPTATYCGEKAKAEYGFDGCGKEKLKAQLRALVAAIIPEELVPAMSKADVGYLLTAVSSVKEDSDHTGKVIVMTEKKLLQSVFVTVKTRTNNSNYATESKAAVYKTEKE